MSGRRRAWEGEVRAIQPETVDATASNVWLAHMYKDAACFSL